MSPERATEIAAMLTGAKISELPVLLRTLKSFAMPFAKWKLVLDRNITVVEKASGVQRTTREVYVGLQPITGVPGGNPTALFVPSVQQPVADNQWTHSFAIRSDVPVLFAEISIVH